MELEIAPEKVAHVIIKAREYDVKVGSWSTTSRDADGSEDPEAILESAAMIRPAPNSPGSSTP